VTTTELKYKEFFEQTKNEEQATHLWLQWRCMTDLFFLGYEILGLREAKDRNTGRKLVDTHFHGWLCQVLSTSEDVMVIVPRRHMKTTWVKIKLIQNILKNPFVRQAMYSSTSSLVEQELASIKKMLQTPRLMALFPSLIPDPGKKGTGWEVNRASELTLYRNPEEGSSPQECQIEVYGAGSTVTGKHFDIHIYDDLISEKTTQTMEQVNKTREWYGYIQGVLEPGGQEIYIGTPYHYADLTTFIRNEGIYDKIYKRSVTENGQIIYSYFTQKMLDKIKKRMTPYQWSCLPGDAPIWMADGSFKDYRDIHVGDYVMGYTTGDRSVLTKSRVLDKHSKWADTVKVRLESGREVRCTPDHLWFTGQKNKSRKRSLYAKVIESGSYDWNKKGAKGPYTTYLLHAIDPSPPITIKDKLDYKWLAGIIDGEGSCKFSSISITQSQEKNPEVCDMIEKTLDSLGIKFTRWIRKPRMGHESADYFIINGGRQVKVNIIQNGRPAKSGQIANTILGKKRPFDLMDKIIEITPYKEEEVFSMQTETGNYIAYGYGSKNCQYVCDPQPQEDQLFPPPQPQFDELPKGKYTYYISVDPAATVKTWSDETAIVVGAVSEIGHVFIVDAFHFKKTGDKTAEFILQLNERYKPRKIGIEFRLQEHLRYVIELTKSNWEASQRTQIFLPIEGIDISNKSKYDRINLTLGSFIRSNRMAIKSNLTDLMTQMQLYNRNYSGKDDLVDACSMLFSVIDTFSFKYWSQPLGLVRKGMMTLETIFKKKTAVGWEDRFSK
jgi:hypothetical protein